MAGVRGKGGIMKVRFDEIPTSGLQVRIGDASWFPAAEVTRRGEVAAEVFLRREGTTVLAEGSLHTVVVYTCDRCLAEYEAELAAEFSVDFEYSLPGGRLGSECEEHLCDANEMDVAFLDKPEIDISELLSEQVYLSVPARKICRESCLGLCPRCGVNLNLSSCTCQPDDDRSPFGVLARLK